MADQIEIGGLGVTVLQQGHEVDALGVTVLGSEGHSVGSLGITVLSAEENIEGFGVTILADPEFAGGRRIFPLPPAQRLLQTQSGKRTFPLAGRQELE